MSTTPAGGSPSITARIMGVLHAFSADPTYGNRVSPRSLTRLFLLVATLSVIAAAQTPSQVTSDTPATRPASAPASKASGPTEKTEKAEKADADAGTARRNENVQFNLVDNNAQKEQNTRLGTTATLVREFSPANNYFGAELGNAPKASFTVPTALKAGFHGGLQFGHLNSIFSARTFFQVGAVQPAHENDYGFNFGVNLWTGAKLFANGGMRQVRGSVNGNVLVPRPDERTALTTNPAARTIVEQFLAAYPKQLPNRTDIDPRALNTNSPQTSDSDNARLRLDQALSARDQLTLEYQFTALDLHAFQLVAGQNPDTTTKSHLARIVWTRTLSPQTLLYLSASYDRQTAFLRPEPNAVGPYVKTAGLDDLGPQTSIPINRAQNLINYAGLLRHVAGHHSPVFGFTAIRRQINGSETESHRGYFQFTNNFGRDAVTNLRLGIPTQYIVSIGNIHRGFRTWDFQGYAGDVWQVRQNLTLNYGVRWQPSLKPTEVNRLNEIPYHSDWNNVGPNVGFAYRVGNRLGVVRGAYGVQFGEIFPVTFQQLRFTPPGNNRYVVNNPDLVNPLGTLTAGGQSTTRPTIYALDPRLVVPYSHQYNVSWEPEFSRAFAKVARLQFGYVGSRSHKLFSMWYTNRARPVPGIPQTTATTNLRRPDQRYADIRTVVNASRAYYDAARVTLVVPQWRGLSADVSYWLSKAIDLGSGYTNTASDADSKLGRSQSEFETHRDMKGLSTFDQPHAFTSRLTYAIPAIPGRGWLHGLSDGWSLTAVTLLKSGTPFNIATGSDAPGFGNVDGSVSDRPNILDPSILGRTVGNPDTSRLLLPRAAFGYISPTEERGSIGRNTFRKGAIRNVNASLSRLWSLHHDQRLTLRAESVNLFNTPQFAEPGFELSNANFGQITNTLNEGRTFRFTLQLGW